MRNGTRAELISVVDNTTFHAKLSHHRKESVVILKVRGIEGLLEKDPDTMQWMRLCFEVYEDRFIIQHPAKINSLGGVPVYEADIVLDHQICLANLMVSAKHAKKVKRYAG